MKTDSSEELAISERMTMVTATWPESTDRGELCATRIVLPDRTEVYAYRAEDGAWVVELDSGSCADTAMADSDDVPYARIYVNDERVEEHSPLESLAGSREDRRLDSYA
ncbi:MAG: hypothetical protein ACREX8_06535 [Gammaproteobacteria bacterium]